MAQSWRKDFTVFFIYVLFVTTIGPFQFGYHLAELNAPQDIITCQRKKINSTTFQSSLPQCIPMTTFQFSLVSSIYTLGGLVGAMSAGTAGARYGRLRTMRYTTIFFTLGPIAEACASNVGILALGRFISGLGAGAAVVVVPIYISEISPPDQRGFFGSITQIMVNCGILLTQLLGYFLSRRSTWRIILGTAGVIGFSQLFGLYRVVESPKWHAEHGFAAEAKTNLQSIRGRDVNIQKEIIGWGLENSEIEEDEEERLISNDQRPASSNTSDSRRKSTTLQNKPVGIFQVLRDPRYNRAAIAVIGVMAAQQFTGINSIVMYGVSLLAELLEQSSALLNVCVALLNVVLSTACAPLPDRIGRKPCLLLSIAGMGISSFFLALAIINSIRIMAAITVLTFVGSFCVGLGAVPFILSSELVGPEAVAATQSLALAANWISTFIVAQFFPMLNQALGKGIVFFVFSGLAAFFAAFVAWWVPETRGKKDIDQIWGRTTTRTLD